MYTVAVNFLTDRMPRPVNEKVSVPGRLDNVATGIVDFPPETRTVLGKTLAHKFDSRHSSVTDRIEDLDIFRRGICTDKAAPGYVVIDRSRLLALAPEVYEYRITFFECITSLFCRLEMGVRRVIVRPYYRDIMSRVDILFIETTEDKLRDLVLGDIPSLFYSAVDLSEGFVLYALDYIAGL